MRLPTIRPKQLTKVLEKKKILKAIISFSVFFSLLLFSSGRALAQSATVSISPVKQEVKIGEEVKAVIQITEISNLYCFQLDLTYDSTILEYVSLEKGTFIGDEDSTYWVPLDTTTPGTIKNIAVTRTIPGETVSGSGDLVSVTFKALTKGTSTIGIENLILGDSAAKKISFTKQVGEIVVSEQEALAPSLPPSEEERPDQKTMFYVAFVLAIVLLFSVGRKYLLREQKPKAGPEGS